MKKLVIYHANCPDGFGSAWVVRKALGDNAVEFFPATYSRPAPDVRGRDVIMVDFSYPRAVMEGIIKDAASILVLDHHESAEKGLAGLTAPSLTMVFGHGLSGVGVTWRHFFPDRPVPRLLQHVQDMDIWTWKVPGTAEVMASVFSYPYEFTVWDSLMGKVGRLRREGVALHRAREKEIAELYARAGELRLTIGGYKVRAFNVPYLYAKLAAKASIGEPFSATFWGVQGPDGPRVQFSLRSAEDGLNVADIAKLYGGGGHAHAAGFEVSPEALVAMVSTPGPAQAAHVQYA